MVLHIAAVGDSHTSNLPDRGEFVHSEYGRMTFVTRRTSWTGKLEDMLKLQGIDALVHNIGIPGILAADVKRISGYTSRLEDRKVYLRAPLLYKTDDKPVVVILQGGANDISQYVTVSLNIEKDQLVASPFVNGSLMERKFKNFDAALDFLTSLYLARAPHNMPSKMGQACLQLKEAGIGVVYWNIPPLGGPVSLDSSGGISLLSINEIWKLAAQRLRKPLNDRLQRYCAANAIAHVDVASALSDNEGWLAPAYDSGDNLHLNEAGNTKVAVMILEALMPIFPTLAKSK